MGIGSRSAYALSTVFLLVLSVSCAQGHCRRKQSTPEQAKPVEPAPPATVQPEPRPNDRVLVYKYDGSLQCGQGKAVPVETMQKELAGITVFSKVKKPDGLMHIQVCGSGTGVANVYEIPAKDLKKAEGKGFKKWEFQ